MRRFLLTFKDKKMEEVYVTSSEAHKNAKIFNALLLSM